MEKIRTFVAVLLPEETRSRLAEIEEKLKETQADVKWVQKENFHITLKFLGSVEKDRMNLVAEAVARARQGIAPFEVVLGGAGVFPGGSRPRVVWVGINSGSERLGEIAKRLDSNLAELGFPREERPFSAHVTLGRARTPRGAQALRAAVEGMKDISVGSVLVDKVVLMKSDLRPAGPIYTPLEEFKLL